MLTQKDLEEIKEIVKEEVKDQVKHLPTKEEFFARMDKLSGEIQTVRDEQVLHTGQHRQINDRFERIDKHLGIDSSV